MKRNIMKIILKLTKLTFAILCSIEVIHLSYEFAKDHYVNGFILAYAALFWLYITFQIFKEFLISVRDYIRDILSKLETRKEEKN